MTGEYWKVGTVFLLNVRQEHSLPIQIDVGSYTESVTFTANGEYLASHNNKVVGVWRVEDGEQVASTPVPALNDMGWGVSSVSVSKDGRWIAAGSRGIITAWDTKTYEEAFTLKVVGYWRAGRLDFSPNSSRLVAAFSNWKAIIWDIALRKQVHTLRPKKFLNDSDAEVVVIAAKYSPHGDRIATATHQCIQVWDSDDGRLLVVWRPVRLEDVGVFWPNTAEVATSWITDLLWFNNHLFVIDKGESDAVSGSTIRQLDASTGSEVSQWLVPRAHHSASIAIPKHGEFIVYNAQNTVSFWDTSKHTQLALIQHPHIHSIALSPDDRFLAIAGDKKIAIKSISRVTNSIPLSSLHPTFQEPVIQIDDAALFAWRQGHLANADALLTAAVRDSQNASHDVLASRALVRARLQQWDAALVDADMPSVIGYIAKSMALVGKGERDKGYEACDIAFERCHSSHGNFILLVKAIIVFMTGEHQDAISRVDDLIAAVLFSSICYVVQAYMYLLLGNSQMETSDYEGAIQSFEHALAKMRHQTSRPLFVVSLISGWKFDDLDIMIRRRLCEALYAAGRTKDAVECFCKMEETSLHGEHLEWARDFSKRSFKTLKHLGDTAVNSQRYEEAVSHYSTALSLNHPSPQDVLVKRIKAFMATGCWKQVADDANQLIILDPFAPWGYEMKHAALHKAGDYDNAVGVLEAMLSKLAQSPDPDVQQHCDRYISPSSTRATIRQIVQRTIRHSPRVLINTTTGRLHDKVEQASAFEALLVFNELVSSMTTRIDYVRIKREVRQYFRYVMLSHRWEENEPLFQQVVHITVYDLSKSPTHDKLQTFCKIARDAGFNWAWSDTCCINKSDHFVLQEALVAMFRWYQGSAMVIVFLRGVRSSSQRGALVQSVWNTRSWTFQEYIASKVIYFYTEDWTMYLDLKMPNHKESPEVISEMEHATGVSAQQLMALRPGLSSIREKLRLASMRQTSVVEDAAYSLLGIFSVTGIPAIYGEGESSLGRLLAHVLAGSGDVSILAWTGESGSFNSCLPAYITVFDGLATSHLPPPIPDAQMERIITTPQSSSLDLNVALILYDRLNELPAPWFAASRMKLSCIAFELLPFSQSHRTRSGCVYRADTVAFGMVEIKTRHDLSRMKSLYLVHPWLDTLLEREDKSNVVVEEDVVPPLSPNTDDDGISDIEIDDDGEFFDANDDFSSLAEPVAARMVPMDRETRARRLVAYLRQPFGALLVTPTASGRRAMDYKRVAADSLITVQFQGGVSLADILQNVRTLDVL
ncbi:hypothetical protein OG21DRAFT_1489089 [Imleria badia]|nr:hypothetical protein OG21DRAFT_1489089 [Imleria badia]